jgi:pantoate--beta-alanine ligase
MPLRAGEMITLKTPMDANAAAMVVKRSGSVVGLVPTMGALHDGHRSLIRKAREECDWVAVSIFVNPTQFGENEDIDRYPRQLADDLAICNEEGADLVFTPSPDDIYMPDHTSWVEVGELTQVLCGMSRPGHFRGVTTVVAKLFNILCPDKAYFGQKDLQQLVVIERMVRDLNFPVRVVRCPIVRETDGVAMSSRNRYLSAEERIAAVALHEALQIFADAVADGETAVDVLLEAMSERIIAEPAAELDYLAIVDAHTLQDVRAVKGPVAVALAVWFGNTRLIDNMLVDASGAEGL